MTAVPLFDGHKGRHCCERPHRLCALRARVVRALRSLLAELRAELADVARVERELRALLMEQFPAPERPSLTPGPFGATAYPPEDNPPVTYDEIDAGWPHQPEPGIVPYDECRPATWADIAAGMPRPVNGRYLGTLPRLTTPDHAPWATEGQPAFRPPTEPAGLPALGPACLLPAERIPPQIAAYFDEQAGAKRYRCCACCDPLDEWHQDMEAPDDHQDPCPGACNDDKPVLAMGPEGCEQA